MSRENAAPGGQTASLEQVASVFKLECRVAHQESAALVNIISSRGGLFQQ